MKQIKRLTALLLTLCLVCGVFPATAWAAGETTYVLAGSDFQANNHMAGAENVGNIIDKIKVDYSTMDGFLFAGDYDVNYTDSANGKATLQATVQGVYGTGMDEIYVQGNHDSDSLVGSTLTASGANDSANYGVFVINEKDYMWYNNDETTIKKTATNLETYLNAKRNAEYTKPIFVVSHLPLHYCMRTREGGNDGMHANYIFDVLNEAGAAGLNIIFMFGHNHSYGWDDYLGGASIFLKKGDQINIAQNSTTVFREETLAFTYMNAGYVGYYGDSYTSTVDKTLTMTTFAITDTDVTISRYDSNGTHDLKSAGVYNVKHPDSAYYSTDTTTVGTPYTLTLNTEITPAGTEVEVPGTGTTTQRTYTRVTSTNELVSGGKYLIIHNGQNDFMVPEVTSDGGTRVGYDLVTGPTGLGNDTVTGEYQEYEWTFTSVDGGWNIGSDAGYMYFEAAGDRHAAQLGTTAHTMVIGGLENNFTFTNATYNGGSYVLNYNGIADLINGYGSGAAPFYIYRMTNEGSSTPTVDTWGGSWVTIIEPDDGSTTYTYTQVTSITAGKKYVIVGNSSDVALMNNNGSMGTQKVSGSGTTVTSSTALTEWTFSGATSGTIVDGTNGLNNNGNSLSIGTNHPTWKIESNGNGTYKIYYEVGTTETYNVVGNNIKYKNIIKSNGTYLTNYYYKAEDGKYYQVSVSRSSWGNKTSYGLFYENDSGDQKWIETDRKGNDFISAKLYTKSGRTTTYHYLTYSNNIFTLASTTSSRNIGTVRLYQFTDKTVIDSQNGLYGKISGELAYNVAVGTAAEDALAVVKAGIGIFYHTGDESAALSFPDDGEGMTWTLDSSYDGVQPGEYAVTIAYNGVKLGVAKVVVPSVSITGYTVEPSEGTVTKGAYQMEDTGALIYVQLEDGKYYTVPVTVTMLKKADGSGVSTGETGTFENLTLTYNGVVITNNFTLNVVAKAGNNYPEYPNEGAVKVNKTATGIDFQSSGIAQVELSASGVPSKKGADVIVMLDLSSSMTKTVNGQTRLSVLEASLESLMTQLQANGEDGEPMDIRIAVADFHRYYTDPSSSYYINEKDHLINGSIRKNADGTNQVYTGSGALNAGAFVDVHDLATNAFSGLSCKSGTNYDYAFDAIYQLGEAITIQNAENGEERDLFVLFMSDGAPFQFNYFSAQSGTKGGTTDARYWNNWLTGTLTDNMKDANARNDYYNAEGKHWMAEAIKGDPANTYPVIRKNSSADIDDDTWVNVNGLGATMYSVGFCLAVDVEITVDSMDTVIKNIASEEEYYFRADSATDLANAFSSIGNDIAYAATNARFVDQIGANFDLQMATSKYSVVDGTTTTNKNLEPKIEILTYDIYTNAEAAAGIIPAGKNIGDRKGTFTVLETVTFNTNGTAAYSTLNSIGPNGETLTAGSNILINGVIYAHTFWYNTMQTGVLVEGVDIPTGVNSDGTTKGSTNILPSETFYWKVGTVQSSELAMRYYVYLEGSMDGTKEAGSYSTNEYAVLYYDNYLGNACQKDTVSPVMAWKEANVSYAFYLVDENGNVVVNQTTGQTGSFANKIAVTNPVVHEKVLLNSDEEVSSIDIASLGVLPEGYALYDYDDTNGEIGATYTVRINSNTTGSWEITTVKDVHTTYVTQYDPNDASAYSNALTTGNELGNDYTHTIVWFAVVWKVQALPDAVVIDYGLPVDISVLINDMFGTNGKLAGVGAYSDSLNFNGYDTTLASGFGTSYVGTYGTATIDATMGKVRYIPHSMQMNGYEKFAYAVNYTGAENAGYYYDTVTVIPATTIYYEDSFLTYTASNTGWTDEGTAIDGVTQAEDRPGAYSLTDANNIYGYDSANNRMSTFSLGTAKKVHVDADSYAKATFTFYGTGFDVIGMTSNTTGVIAVKVTDSNGNKVKATMVDTYYGYTYANGEWVVAPDVEKSLYQVPVLQIKELPYGKYTVTITATYAEVLDQTTADGYDLYLDAIRIYDPANNGAGDGMTDTTIEDAYKADGEGWPSYTELRDKIIEQETLGNADTNTVVTGLVFIDGNAEVGDAQIADYASCGPNNEVYIAPGQRVAFILDTPDNIASVRIGIKSADGETGTYTINNIAQTTNTETGVKAGDYYGANTTTISTTTGMYYDLTGWKNDIIVISNTGDRYNTTGVISVTNIKSTYISDPSEAVTTSLFMTRSAAMLTLRTLNTPVENETTESDAVVPETDVTTTPEVTVPEVEGTTSASTTDSTVSNTTNSSISGSTTETVGKDDLVSNDAVTDTEDDATEEIKSDTSEEVAIEDKMSFFEYIIAIIKEILEIIADFFAGLL